MAQGLFQADVQEFSEKMLTGGLRNKTYRTYRTYTAPPPLLTELWRAGVAHGGAMCCGNAKAYAAASVVVVMAATEDVYRPEQLFTQEQSCQFMGERKFR